MSGNVGIGSDKRHEPRIYLPFIGRHDDNID